MKEAEGEEHRIEFLFSGTHIQSVLKRESDKEKQIKYIKLIKCNVFIEIT